MNVLHCWCLDTGIQILIPSVVIATTTLVAFTGYQVGKNNLLSRKKKNLKVKFTKKAENCDDQHKVVEVVENKYENVNDVISNIDDVINNDLIDLDGVGDLIGGEDNASVDETEDQQYDDVLDSEAKSNDVTIEVDDEITEASAPTREEIYEDLNDESIYEDLETIMRENTKVLK